MKTKILCTGVLLFVLQIVFADYSPSIQYNRVRSYSYPGGNLVNNGSFENNYSLFDYEGWYEGLTTDPSSFSIINISDDIPSYEGAQHIAVNYVSQSTNAPSPYKLMSDLFPLKPNTAYSMYFWYQARNLNVTNGVTVTPSIHFWKEKNFEYNRETQSFDYMFESSAQQSSELGPTVFGPAYQAETQWTMVSVQFTTPALTNYGNIFLLHGSDVGASGNFYFDNVIVVEGTVSPDSIADLRHPDNIAASTKFLNDENKVVQTVTQVGGNDIVKQNYYDELGRISKTTLPIGGNMGVNQHSFIPAITADFTPGDFLANFYNQSAVDGSLKIYDVRLDDALFGQPAPQYPEANGVAYSETRYEDSPLGRVVQSSSPGASWSMTSSHTTRTGYSSVPDLSSATAAALPAPVDDNGQFFVKQDTGTDGQITRTFTDQMGRVVRTSSKLVSGWVVSDNQYDGNGNLIQTTAPADPNGNHLVSTMTFDGLNEMSSETTPSTGTTNSIFDAMGRVRFTQTANQAAANSFSFAKYDEFGRVIQSGEVLDASLFTQADADNSEFPCVTNCSDPAVAVNPNSVRFRVLNHYDDTDAQLSCAGGGANPAPIANNDIGFLAENPSGTAVVAGYDLYAVYQSALSLEQGQSGQIKILALYSDSGSHDITPASGDIFVPVGNLTFSFESLLQSSTDGTAAMQAFNNLQAQQAASLSGTAQFLAGRLYKTLSCNYELATALGEPAPREVSKTFSYDKYGNVVSVTEVNRYAQNPDDQIQVKQDIYDVQNRLLQKTVCPDLDVDPGCNGPERHVENYEYDQLGRIAKVTDKNGNTIVNNHYNYIGQLSAQSMGGDLTATDPKTVLLQKAYHLQGWLTQTNAKTLTNGTALFQENLDYETGPNPRFDGNISEADYSYSNVIPSNRAETDVYAYDDLNRLTAQAASYTDVNRNTLYIYYDDGRIGALERNTNIGTYGYDIQGRLQQVSGNLIPGRNMNLPPNGGKVFDYDANGNLITDTSKTLGGRPLEVFYRADNLPYMMTFNEPGLSGQYNMVELFMAYDEGGNRVAKNQYVNGAWSLGKDYFQSGKEIREFQSMPTKEYYDLAGLGRVSYTTTNSDGDKEFYLKDHLGSTRETYDLLAATITYGSHYYPYGMQFSEFNTSDPDVTQKFTGKELDDGTELNYFGGRYQDPDLGRWMSPDPRRQHFDLYEFAGADPINRIDPDGRGDIKANDNLASSLLNSISNTDVGQNVLNEVKALPQDVDVNARATGVPFSHSLSSGPAMSISQTGNSFMRALGLGWLFSSGDATVDVDVILSRNQTGADATSLVIELQNVVDNTKNAGSAKENWDSKGWAESDEALDAGTRLLTESCRDEP